MKEYSYINFVEEEISKIFNKIYDSFIINKKLDKIYKESSEIENLNKILYQIILNLINEIDIKKLQNILKKKNNYQKIILIIKKYISYYLLLYISFLINDEDFYKNLIIKLQKLDSTNKLLFNLDDSSNILDIYIFLIEFMKILDLYKNNINEFNNKILKNNNYKNFIKFINKEVNEENLNILTLKSNLLYHNNIVFILIKNLYLKNDVKIVYNILEEDDDTVYNYINIIVPIVNYIDQNIISNSLDLQEKKSSIITDIFYLLNEKEIKENISDDEKINVLCKNKIITPIVDDILRYHKDTEIYNKDANVFDKNNTKIKYIISKVSDLQNLYYKDEKEYKKTKQLFYKRLNYRNAILYNDLEEIDIIRKLFLKGKTALENNEFINNLLELRKYAYINFNSIKLSGFSYKFNKTVPAVRFTNIKYNDPKKYSFSINNKIETRVAPEDEKVNIVGFLLSNNLINNIKIKDLKNIKNDDNYEKIYNKLLNTLKNNDNSNYYWIFNKNDYKFIKIFQKNFSFENIDKCSLCKYIFLNIYDIASEIIYNKIKNNLNKVNNISFYNLYNYVNFIQSKNFNINYLLMKNNIDKIITKLIKNEKDIKDINENIIKGFEGQVIKLPIVNIKKKKINKIVFDIKKKKMKII